MKILITCFKLNEYSGVELFVLDLARELRKKGHSIFVFSAILGKISQEIESLGIKVTNDILELRNEKFDLIHAQHSITAIAAKSVFPETKLILMVHGVVPDLEQLFRIDFGIDHYISGSENSKKHIAEKYKINREKIDVVGNFIDTEKFHSKYPVNKKLENLLVLSNHYRDEIKNNIESACSKFGISVFHVGLPDNSVEKVEESINKADLVVAIGRGALESMASERNVILYDIFGGDGFVDENNFQQLKKMNFSGLLRKKGYSSQEFEAELEKYNPAVGSKLRKLVEKEYSREKTIETLETIYKKVIFKNNSENFKKIKLEIFETDQSKNFKESQVSRFIGSDDFWLEIEKYGPVDNLREEVDNLVTKHIWKKEFFISEFIEKKMKPGRLICMGIRIFRKRGFAKLAKRMWYFFEKYGMKILGAE